MKKITLLFSVLAILCANPALAQNKVIDLSGSWGFQLDPNDFERAFENSGAHKDLLFDKVNLPGTTDSNQKGIKTTNKPINRLSRYYEYVGRHGTKEILSFLTTGMENQFNCFSSGYSGSVPFI
jgi:hypothetical protein